MERIVGQTHAVELIQAAVASGKVHHAWIFHGPLGVGKFTTAIELAKIILDPNAAPDLTGRIAADPDGETARLVEADNHPDLHIIRKELALTSSVAQLRTKKLTNIPIDLLREHMIGGETSDGAFHQASAYLKPTRGYNKVFIIDEAELLDSTGQNSILKTLEEPPEGTYIILITTQEMRLLPTIRSRCQRIAFTPLGDEEMNAWFSKAVSERDEFAEIDEKSLEWIREFAAGSPGLAVLAGESRMHEWRERLAPMLRELIQGKYPAELPETLASLVDDFAKEWVKRHENASKDMANKDGARRVFRLLGAHAHKRLQRAVERDEPIEPWLAVIDLLAEAERDLRRNVNLKHLLANLASQWSEVMSPEPARSREPAPAP